MKSRFKGDSGKVETLISFKGGSSMISTSYSSNPGRVVKAGRPKTSKLRISRPSISANLHRITIIDLNHHRVV